MMKLRSEQIKGVVIGHAVADALGVPVEFQKRESLAEDPVTDMRGFGTYDVPAGAWSDDTSMSLAALDALAEGVVDHFEIMKNFALWLKNAKYTPTGTVFDVGGTCMAAISEFVVKTYQQESGTYQAPVDYFNPVFCGLDDEFSNGNGSLMRIHPFVLYAYAKGLNEDALMALVEDGSALTHAHECARVGCLIYAFVLSAILEKPSKSSVSQALAHTKSVLSDYRELARYGRIFEPDFADIPQNGIKSGGYVVDTLEAALWCLLTTDSYAECVLKAVNLGNDTDTVAAVAGGLAGALYGYEAILQSWLQTLLRREEIEDMCEKAHLAWMSDDM